MREKRKTQIIKKIEAYKPGVSYGNDEIKERFESSLLSWGVLLNLQNTHFVFITHQSRVMLSDSVDLYA